MAIDKLKKNKNKKLINVSILIIRISGSSNHDCYKLCSSRPCVSCMYKIINVTNLGYRITKIYYSTENGNIICYKLKDIIQEKQFISKYYRVTPIPKILKKKFALG